MNNWHQEPPLPQNHFSSTAWHTFANQDPGKQNVEKHLFITTGHHEKHLHLSHIQLLKLFNDYNNRPSSYKMNILSLGINWQQMKYVREREKGRVEGGGRDERETLTDCFLHAPQSGTNPQPRYVP